MTKINYLVNAQVDINRAVFAYNDAKNDNKLGMNDQQLKAYILKCARSAMDSLAEFREENK